MALDISSIRRQFPILRETFDGHPLVYLDNAATTQKPVSVLDAMRQYYEHDNANPHRGMHPLAERATAAYEHTRDNVAKFLHAAHRDEIIFTKGATEGVNIVAKGFGKLWKEGDAVILSVIEHHSNIVPWLQLKEEKGIDVRWIDIDDEGRLDLDSLDSLLRDGRVKLVSVTAQSNVLGNRPPLKEIIGKAHAAGALVLVDAAQSIAHHQTDVQALDCDLLVFSAHKLYGPTGLGVLYGKEKILSVLPPFLGGGMMIHEVFTDCFSPADIPSRFEGGTQAIAEAVGLSAAIDWMGAFQWSDIEAHEHALIAQTQKELSGIDGMRIIGPKKSSERSACISFDVEGIHPHDLTEILGRKGICLRAGHHCTQPLHRRLGFIATTRLSVGIYNTTEEIAVVAPAIREAQKKFK
jgi:cysteine desulfurase/selenocysteine lyase